jgi:hypothetical protein
MVRPSPILAIVSALFPAPVLVGTTEAALRGAAMSYTARTHLLTFLLVALASGFFGQATATKPQVDFSTYFGGNGNTSGSIKVDSKGYLYVVGTTYASEFPTTPGAYRRTPRLVCTTQCFYFTGFLAKFTRDGKHLVYSTFIDEASPEGFDIDSQGNVYITGLFVYRQFNATPGALASFCQPEIDPDFPPCTWLIKMNATGTQRVYATLLSETRYVSPRGLAVNSAGEVYIGGQATAEAAFVVKVSARGDQLLYATYLGFSNPRTMLRAIAVARNDKLVVVGRVERDFPTTRSAYSRTYKGNGDAFVAKLSPDGSTLTASTMLGGTGSEEPWDVAVDPALNVFVLGSTTSVDYPTTPGAFRTTSRCTTTDCTDTFLTKIPPDFSKPIYSTFLARDTNANNLAVDAVGHAYVSGVTAVTGYPMVKPIHANATTILISKFNTAGTGLLFSSYYGTKGTFVSGGAVDLDPSGDAYFAGFSNGPGFPTTPDAFQLTNPSKYATVLWKFNLPPCNLSSTSPSVTICVPSSSTPVTSPVLVAAGATHSRPISGMVVYVDGVRRYSIAGFSHFDTRISMPSGSHRLTVKAWDTAGQVFSATEDVIVK